MSETVDMDDLNAFENSFFEKEAAAPVEEAPAIEDNEDVIENRDESPATEVEDPDTEAVDEQVEGEDEDEEEEAPKPKGRKSAQERIRELTAARREAERREADLIRRLEAIEAKAQKEVEDKVPLRDALPKGAPDPDAEGKDGEPLYPLGEFDPKYIRDLTRFTIAEESRVAREQELKEAEQTVIQEELEKIKDNWFERLDALEAEVPSIRDDIAELTEVFEDLDPSYGEYLATTVMSSEVGPQIMHYFSQNIGEAQKIVAAGPAAATLALGRLEAKFLKAVEAPEPKRNTKVVSKAPTPPASPSRGSGGKFATAPDTDDLAAFEREFFKPRGR